MTYDTESLPQCRCPPHVDKCSTPTATVHPTIISLESLVEAIGVDHDNGRLALGAREWFRITTSIKSNPIRSMTALPSLVDEWSRCGDVGQLLCIKQRVALAESHKTCLSARSNLPAFRVWLKKEGRKRRTHFTSNHRGRGPSTVVKQGLIDVALSPMRRREGIRTAKNRLSSKMDGWRKAGNRWAEIITRFGHGILLLVPKAMTNEK